jgi:hypothetical protein
MAVRVIPQKFRASDGTEFPTQLGAERHESLLKAMHAFDKARRDLCFATVQTYTTADGLPFEFDSHCDYLTLVTYYGWPELQKIGLWGWYNQQFEIDGDRLKVVVGDGQNRRTFEVTTLYRTEDAARAELLKRRRAHIADLKSRIANEGGSQ